MLSVRGIIDMALEIHERILLGPSTKRKGLDRRKELLTGFTLATRCRKAESASRRNPKTISKV